VFRVVSFLARMRRNAVAAQEKVAFITGANKGIGLETARGLGKLGIAVVLGSRDEARGRAAAEKLRAEGIGAAEAVRFDVTRLEDHRQIARFLDDRFGKLDILVNNAGVMLDAAESGTPGGFNTAPTVAPDILRQTFDTNFFAVVALTQALLPLIRKAPAGRIVNLSSILGSLALHTDPASPIYAFKAFAYDASKTALNAFTVHLAHALRDTAIKVNSAHPGWVKTDMGGAAAPMELSEGGKTSVQLATLPDNGPSGGYFHLGQPLPW
jgi:NAD(P)-dependent dehydrogenase (short-subunit alcohol dehydrogenase family)